MPLVPYVIEQTGRGERMYDVYSRLLKERIIFLGTPIDSEVANVIVAQLLLLDSQSSEQEISMYINCPGGEVYAGLAIYDTMQFINAPVATTCVGIAMSMGSVILMAGAEGKRAALPHSRIMIHQPSGGAQGMAADIEIQAREILRMRHDLNTLYAKYTGKPLEEIERAMDRDKFMSTEEAKAFGLIDEVFDKRPMPSEDMAAAA